MYLGLLRDYFKLAKQVYKIIGESLVKFDLQDSCYFLDVPLRVRDHVHLIPRHESGFGYSVEVLQQVTCQPRVFQRYSNLWRLFEALLFLVKFIFSRTDSEFSQSGVPDDVLKRAENESRDYAVVLRLRVPSPPLERYEICKLDRHLE